MPTESPAVSQEERREIVATWREATERANAFLASPYRRTLPAGRYEFDDRDGMRFVTAAGTWPIAVRCTTWGDLCVACGFAAQEREDGFVVGSRGRARDRLVDNSLFVSGWGGWRASSDGVADLILHETTHVVWREGTVGFWNGVSYYLEALFLFRYANHSDERRPNATDEEFGWFAAAQQPDSIAAHLAQESDTCRHGPFTEPIPPAPLPPPSPITAPR